MPQSGDAREETLDSGVCPGGSGHGGKRGYRAVIVIVGEELRPDVAIADKKRACGTEDRIPRE